jgi:hypothetical protein
VTDIQTAIDRLDRVPFFMTFEIRTAMQKSVLTVEAEARSLAVRDTRRLASSITSKVVGSGLAIQGQIGPSVQYGAPVEFGRKIGARMPPVDALLGWVQRHWRPALVGRQGVLAGFERELVPTNKRTPRRNVTEQQIRRRAFGLAIAIRRRGIAPNPYMRPAYYRSLDAILGNFRTTGRRVAASIAGQELT